MLWRYHKNVDKYFHTFISEAKEYADDIGAIFAETSAVTAVNVQELFESIGKYDFLTKASEKVFEALLKERLFLTCNLLILNMCLF